MSQPDPLAQNIPPTVSQLIATHQLSPPRRVYQLKLLPRGIISSSLFILLGAAFFVGSFLSFGTGGFFFRLLLGLVLLAIGLFPPILHILNRSLRVYVCSQGLVHLLNGKTEIICWDQVETVQIGPGASVTLHRTDGKVFIFNNSLVDFEDLAGIIADQTTQFMLPQALATYEAGTPVIFGDLKVDQQGLSKGDKTLPWDRVKSISTVRTGNPQSPYQAVVIRQQGNPIIPWANIGVADIPNILIFYELTERILKNQQEGTSSFTAQESS